MFLIDTNKLLLLSSNINQISRTADDGKMKKYYKHNKNSSKNNHLHNFLVTISSFFLIILITTTTLISSVSSSPGRSSLFRNTNNNNYNHHYNNNYDNVEGFYPQNNPYATQELVSSYSKYADGVNRALGIFSSESTDYNNHPASPFTLSSHHNYVYESTNVGGSPSAGGYNYNYHGDNGSSYYPVNKYSTSSSSSSASNFKSAIGVNIILAVARENIWTGLTIPGLNDVVRSAPATLPDVLKNLLKTAEDDYNTKVRTIIFTPTWVKSTLRLSEMKCEVKQAYFEHPKIAINTVNNVVSSRFPSSSNFPVYLQEPLSDSTESLILNMKEQRGSWPGVVSYVGSSIFHDSESVEMFEVRGRFNYVENDEFIMVTVPFKLTHLAVTLILPRSAKDNSKPADYSHVKTMYNSLSANKDEQSANFRIHLPIKTFTSRTPLVIANASRCNETGSSYEIGTCLDFLDTVSYTSFSPAEFQFVVLNGGVVSRQGRLFAHIKAAGNPNNLLRSSGSNFLESWRLYLPERKQLRRNNYPDTSNMWRWRIPAVNSYSSNSEFRRSYHSNSFLGSSERLLIFNQHFNWFVRASL